MARIAFELHERAGLQLEESNDSLLTTQQYPGDAENSRLGHGDRWKTSSITSSSQVSRAAG
jgi:hypothetical protein